MSTLPPPFDAISPDPLQFMLGLVKQAQGPMVNVVNRSSARIGRSFFDVHENDDPTQPRIGRIPLKVTTANTPAQIALSFLTVCRLNAGVVADEMFRVGTGQPRGFEGEQSTALVPFSQAASVARDIQVRGFTGAEFAALLPLLAPVLIQLLPVLFKAIFSLVEMVGDTFLSRNDPEVIPPDPNSATVTVGSGFARLFQDPLVLGAAVVVAFLLLKRV